MFYIFKALVKLANSVARFKLYAGLDFSQRLHFWHVCFYSASISNLLVLMLYTLLESFETVKLNFEGYERK